MAFGPERKVMSQAQAQAAAVDAGLRAYLMEYGLLGLVTAALAAGLGSVAAYAVVTQLLHLGFTFQAAPVAAVALPGVAVTLALGFLGTWRALDRKAAPLLRNQ